MPDGSFLEIYNGPGDLIWKQFEGKKLPSNGQFQISFNRLKSLGAKVDRESKLPVIA